MKLTKKIIKEAIKEAFDDFEASNKYGRPSASPKQRALELLDELESEVYSSLPSPEWGERTDLSDNDISSILIELRSVIESLHDSTRIGTRGERS